MRDHVGTVTAQAVIETLFSLGGRGQVLVLEELFQGVIPKSGFVETSLGVLPYSGPEFVDGHERTGRLAVVVPVGHGAERLRAGEAVMFFERV